MTEHKIASHSIRTWSSRSFEKLSLGVAMAAIYLFDGSGEHVGTASFFPGTLGDDQPPATLSGRRIELRLLFDPEFQKTNTMLAGEEPVCVYYNGPHDAGFELCSE